MGGKALCLGNLQLGIRTISAENEYLPFNVAAALCKNECFISLPGDARHYNSFRMGI